MKTILLFTVTVLLCSLSKAQNTAIPDPNFEQALIDLGYDVAPINGSVPIANIENITYLSMVNDGIDDLTGIEDFVSLTSLFVSNNNLTNVDLSNNVNLIQLNLEFNEISTLDISSNTLLETLGISNNNISSIDLSNNPQLNSLDLRNNNLNSLDVSTNLSLETIQISNSNLTAIDLTDNIALDYINIISNPQLASFNIRTSYNANISTFISLNNPVLYCIEVGDYAYSTNNWTQVDDHTFFSEDCDETVSIPDDNFEQALIDLGYDSGPLNNSVLRSNIDTITELNISGRNISSLTGIFYFTSLTVLNASNNTISGGFELSNSLNLADLNLSYNAFASIILTDNVNLTDLNVSNNQLTFLILNTNTLLETVNLSDNNITSLDVSNNPELWRINAGNCQLSTIDVSNNPLLGFLTLSDNNLNSIDLSANTSLVQLILNNNNLSSIDVSANNQLVNLYLSNNNLSDIDVSTNILLQNLRLENNNLSSIDLSSNTSLEAIELNYNNLSSLDLSLNTALNYLECTDNELTLLNVKNGNNLNLNSFFATNNPNLTCIEVDNAGYSAANWYFVDAQTSFSENCHYGETYVPDDNFELALINLGYDSAPLDDYVPMANIQSLTYLDIQYNNIADLTGIEDFTSLSTLRCIENNLTSVDLSSNTNLAVLLIANNNLTSLDITSNTLLEALEISNTEISTLDVSNNLQLNSISAANCQLTDMDLSNHNALTYVDLRNNQLTDLNVKNGNNANITDFFAQNNPDLFCIEVDNAAYSTTNWTSADVQTTFSEDCELLSISDMDAKSIKIYPNPVSDVITVSSVMPINSIAIYDMLGKKVMSISNINQINVSHLISGVYFVKVKSNTGEVTKKIIKN